MALRVEHEKAEMVEYREAEYTCTERRYGVETTEASNIIRELPL